MDSVYIHLHVIVRCDLVKIITIDIRTGAWRMFNVYFLI